VHGLAHDRLAVDGPPRRAATRVAEQQVETVIRRLLAILKMTGLAVVAEVVTMTLVL
jgi:hypothetical protein